MAALCVIRSNDDFRSLRQYILYRKGNPLKKTHALVAAASKLLRVIFTILKRG